MKSLKIAGISGSGKTTLIKSLIRLEESVVHLSFSDYLRNYKAAAKEEWQREINCFFSKNFLILMDEHLEWFHPEIINEYIAENTCGIIFLEVEIPDLMERRKQDLCRKRCDDCVKAFFEQEISRRRAVFLSSRLNIPLIIKKGESLEDDIRDIKAFIKFVRDN